MSSETLAPETLLANELDARLSAPGAIDARCFEEFMATQRRLGLTHGERALGRHLRPIIIGEARYRAIARAAELILSALATVAARASADATLADALGLTAAERALAEIDPGYPQALAVGRLDMLLDGDDFHVLELNADSPAGITDQAMIHRALSDLPHMRALAEGGQAGSVTRRMTAHVPAPQDKLVGALAEVFAAWSGGRRLNTIAIVDWLGVDTTGELQAVAALLNAAGYEAVCVDPDQLSHARGRLRAEVADIGQGGRRTRVGKIEIDLVYRRVITSELVSRRGMDHPLIRAYRAQPKGIEGRGQIPPVPSSTESARVMNLFHDAELCREAAGYFHHRAAVTYDARLRESYIGLAMEYERLAAVLERIAIPGPAGSHGAPRAR